MNGPDEPGGTYELSVIGPAQRRLTKELRACNALTARYGLMLPEAAIGALAQKRADALSETGRVEFGESVIPKLIEAFCDSPYLMQDEYEAVLGELTDAFYYFKNESFDLLTDDELIAAMRTSYDESGGSVDAVIGTSLETLCRGRRFGEETDGDDG